MGTFVISNRRERTNAEKTSFLVITFKPEWLTTLVVNQTLNFKPHSTWLRFVLCAVVNTLRKAQCRQRLPAWDRSPSSEATCICVTEILNLCCPNILEWPSCGGRLWRVLDQLQSWSFSHLSSTFLIFLICVQLKKGSYHIISRLPDTKFRRVLVPVQQLSYAIQKEMYQKTHLCCVQLLILCFVYLMLKWMKFPLHFHGYSSIT